MKRFFALLFAAALLIAACGADPAAPNTIRGGKTLSEAVETVRAEFCSRHAVEEMIAMPMPIDRAYLTDMLGIPEEQIAETAGWISMSMTNADAFFAVRAKEGQIQSVSQALASHVRSLVAQYEVYPVADSLERAQAAKVLQKGDYAFLIAVGVGDGGDYDAQVQEVIDDVDALFS